MEQEIKEALQDWAKMIKPYKKANHYKATIQLLNTFGPFIGIWILMYFSLDWSYWITLLLAIVNGLFLGRIFIIQHDCGHQSFFENKQLNNIVGWFCSFFSSIPYSYWARVHNYHHGHIGQLEHRSIGDIDFYTVNEFRELPPDKKFLYRVFRNPIVLFFMVPTIYLVWQVRIKAVNFKGGRSTYIAKDINTILLVLVFIFFGIWLGWANFLMVHIPIVYCFATFSFWFFYIQHQHESTYMQWTKNWDYLLAAMKGSSFYNLPKLFHWLTGNIGYHHIHHLSAKIPNYNLQQCAKENPILQKYVLKLSFSESLKMIHNKLWDEEQQRMISFREYHQLEKLRTL